MLCAFRGFSLHNGHFLVVFRAVVSCVLFLFIDLWPFRHWPRLLLLMVSLSFSVPGARRKEKQRQKVDPKRKKTIKKKKNLITKNTNKVSQRRRKLLSLVIVHHQQAYPLLLIILLQFLNQQN
jgi:hypothetical protein